MNWAHSQGTEAFLRNLQTDFRPSLEWEAAETLEQLYRLKGQAQILHWVERYIDERKESEDD